MKRAFRVFTAVLMCLALLSACGRAEESAEQNPWEPQIENLRWGMSEEEIRELYQSAEEETADGLLYLTLEKPAEVCGVSMNVTLKLDDSFGLIRVTGMAKEADYGKLEQRLTEQLSEYRTGAQPNDGAGWKSEAAGEQYEKEALAQAYASVFGEGVISDTYLEGILGSPLVFYELKKTDGECRFVIDATVKEEMEYIFRRVS